MRESLYDMIQRIRREAEQGVWRTGGGRMIPLKEMSVWNLMNFLGILRRRNNPEVWGPWIQAFEAELSSREQEEKHGNKHPDSGR